VGDVKERAGGAPTIFDAHDADACKRGIESERPRLQPQHIGEVIEDRDPVTDKENPAAGVRGDRILDRPMHPVNQGRRRFLDRQPATGEVGGGLSQPPATTNVSAASRILDDPSISKALYRRVFAPVESTLAGMQAA